MNINESYQFLQYLANKSQYGNITPNSFNLIINRAILSKFNELYGREQKYFNGRPIATTSYSLTEKISEALVPFLTHNETAAVTSGLATKPSTLVHMVNMTAPNGVKTQTVKRVEFDRYQNYINDSIDTPTAEFPVYVEVATGFIISPATTASVKLTYLRKPIKANWGYTLVSNRPVYAATGGVNGTSVDIEFADIYHNEIIQIALGYLGIHISNPLLVQAANQFKATGD